MKLCYICDPYPRPLRTRICVKNTARKNKVFYYIHLVSYNASYETVTSTNI